MEARLLEVFNKYISANYSYEWMRLMLECVNVTQPDTFIIGSSYALHGIDTGLLTHQVSLSMTSQDLEYDYKLLEYASGLLQERGLKKVALVLGEYAMYDRMSKSKMGRKLIESVYEPILCSKSEKAWLNIDTGIVDDDEKKQIEKLCHDYLMQAGKFFNEKYTRADNCEEKYRGIVWDELDDSSRDYYSCDRANTHNKLVDLLDNQVKENIEENTLWLNKIAEFCQSNGVDLYVVIPPFSIEYEHKLNPKMKEILLEKLEQMPYPVHYFDLNEATWDGIFLQQDFFDMDHLNDMGAIKFTNILIQLLQ